MSFFFEACRYVRQSILKILAWVSGILFLSIVLVYAVLATFLWWGDQFDRPALSKADPVYVRTFEPHKIELINDGLISLRRRIELIDGAKHSIELEFFIYELDLAAKVITQKLIAAAQRGDIVKCCV
jgi:putative cardiolipin synthase